MKLRIAVYLAAVFAVIALFFAVVPTGLTGCSDDDGDDANGNGNGNGEPPPDPVDCVAFCHGNDCWTRNPDGINCDCNEPCP